MRSSLVKLSLLALLAGPSLVATACTDAELPARGRPDRSGVLRVDPPPDLSCETAAPPTPEPLVWKRVDALATDLSAALELPAEALCAELGVLPCTEVHRVPLGGSDPIGTGLYTPPPRPLSTSPLALDRMMLAACSERVARDVTGPAVVFTHVDLSATTLDPIADRADMDADLRGLYRRLLARDATDAEIEVLVTLAGPDAAGAPTAREWASLSCFAIGTTTEAIFL